ncbi:uncharacterized protein LOC109707771 [Ananas comosus]|uniref:Uncharacterized protein LOC109707771 n=1 Tax=Ananas comosus TaxID=4615 RepID=A0A6P5EUC1_ANACO|nr:uncharacterized protein LOC109707771 [Ananas comosus]
MATAPPLEPVMTCAGLDFRVTPALSAVADIAPKGNDKSFLHRFVQALSGRFSLKDLGDLHYFLGVEVIPTTQGLFLTQHKYIRDILDRTKMLGAKDVATPLSTCSSLSRHDGFPPTNATEYQKVVGALQYLSITRPDIAFTVNKLSQFMHQPSALHWIAVKCILRYLKVTIYHGLHLKCHSNLLLHAFSDADWVGDKDDRTSTSAYIVFRGTNPISWSSRK